MSGIVRAPERNLVHRGLGRVEFYDLSEEAMDGLQSTLDDLAGEGRRRFSFHAPVVRPAYYPYPAVFQFFLNQDEEKRELNFRALGDTLDRARDWGAEYVVTHLTFGGGDTGDAPAAEGLANDACRRIAGMSAAAGIPVDIEFAAYTDSFNQPGQFLAAVAPHAELGICLDIGHAFIGAALRGRDYWADLEALAGRTRSLHLWNSKGPEHFKQHPHTPLHPSQRPGDGWIDIERSLKAIQNGGAIDNVIFEYPVETLTAQIQEGYDWIAELIESE